ncbi:MAG: SDR family oxidoreductase [Christensenellales bacterium]
MNIGVILAAGDSKRFGGYMLKQYLKINGMEMVAYSIRAMRAAKSIDKIILVEDEEEFKSQYIAKKYNVECIVGGSTRNRSIKNAIDYIKAHYDCDKVVFHDSVRPLINAIRLDGVMNSLDEYEAAVTVARINDALVDNEFSTVERRNYQLIQTPEAFRFGILENFDSESKDLAIASQLKGINVFKTDADVFNMKITYPEELFIAEQLMRLNYYSVNHNDEFTCCKLPEKVLLLGGSGGIGQAIKEYLLKSNVEFRAPSHRELNLSDITVEKIRNYLGDFTPDAIINAAAIYYDDKAGLSDTFDEIFAVNVKSNEVFIEYALTLNKKVNIVLISSSSSTKGRANITNYSAAKAALNSIVESQADRLYDNRVYLNAVIPEKVNTPLIAKLHKTEINPRELLEPEDVINAIMYLASSDEHGKLIHIRKGL